MILIDDGGGGGGGGGGGILYDVYQVTVSWTFTEPAGTAGLLQGFEVIAYTGSDPNDTTKYVKAPAAVLPADRTLKFTYTVSKGVAVGALNAAVRSLYAWGKSPWASTAATATPTGKTVLVSAADNLIHNYNSELGNDAAALGVFANLVVNEPSNAVAGNYVRKLDTAAANETDLSPYVGCMPGDQFYAEAMLKVSSGSAAIALKLRCYDASFTEVTATGVPATSASISATSYGTSPTGVSIVVPAGAVYVKLSTLATTTSASTFGYLDQILFRRVDSQDVSVTGSKTFTANGTFTVPNGVRRVRVTLTGGGGGGGGGTTNSGGGGGGGGAQTVVDIYDVSPGDTFTVVVGAAGAAGAVNGNGGDGTDSSVQHNPTSRTSTASYGSGGKLGSTRTGGNGGGGGGTRGRFIGTVGAGTTGGAAGTNGNDGAEQNVYRFAWITTGGSGAGGGILASSTGKTGGGTWGASALILGGGTTGVALGSGGGGGASYWGRGGFGGAGTPTPGAGNAGASYGAGGGGGGCAAGSAQAGGAGIAGVVIFEWGPMI